ncbi:MAG: hypothetical protein ACOH5I_17605 [Oligoflexus sp.]
MLRSLKILPIVVLSACLLQSCATSSAERNMDIPSNVDVVLSHEDEVKANPSSYLNKTVMVKGTVKELLSGNAFIVEYGPMFRRNKLLVIDPQQRLNVTKGNDVEVIGDVKLFNARQFERQYNLRLDQSLFDEHQDLASIVASSVQPAPAH